MVESSLQNRMQRVLHRLGISLAVVLAPTPGSSKHGEIDVETRTLLIYDATESEAWQTLYHEIVEFKLREVTTVYRTLVNLLIEGFEKLVYQEKESFIEFLPKVSEAIEGVKESE